MIQDNFDKRHIGPRDNDITEMLKVVGADSLDSLIDEIIPASIRLPKPLNLEKGMSEYDFLNHMRNLAAKNSIFKSYIGLGYYNTIVPSVILRNVFENPGWYTSYTPYQAEISQGRLEALLNFQTMVSDLTGMPLANSSLLDEATAAAEAMLMFYHARPRAKAKAGANVFMVSEDLFPQTIDVLKTRAESNGIELVITNRDEFNFDDKVFGAIFQYPDQKGEIIDELPWDVPGAISATLNKNDKITFFTLYGDIIGRVSEFIVLGLLLYAFTSMLKNRKATLKDVLEK